MRILTFTNCPLDPTLGSGKTVLRWSEGLRQLGHEVEIAAPDDYVLELGMRRGRIWRLALGAGLRGPGWLKTFPADLIVFYGAEFGWLVQRLRRRSKKPLLVAHLNGLDALSNELMRADASAPAAPGPRWRELDAACFSGVDRVAALCQADADYVVRRGWQSPANCAIIEPGLENEFLSPKPPVPREHLVVFTGSWAARKDPATVVRVMTGMLQEDPLLRFEMLGAASDANAVYAAFPEPLRARLLVHGKLSNGEMMKVLQRARVFFFPSLYEGYGMALAEALACGCPAVTTATGLGAELRHGEEAWICPFRDAVAMQEGIRCLLRDKAVWEKISRQGLVRVSALSWARQVGELEQTYQRWLGEKSAPGQRPI